MQGGHVDHEAISYVRALHTLVGLVDLIHSDHFAVREDDIRRAKIEYFLCSTDATDRRTGDAPTAKDHRMCLDD